MDMVLRYGYKKFIQLPDGGFKPTTFLFEATVLITVLMCS